MIPDDEPCVLWTGAPKHKGTKRDHGALINWRRQLKGYQKVYPLRFADNRPKILRNMPGEMSELNRRVFPVAYRMEWPDEYFLWKHRKRLRVIGRENFIDGGPVGYRRGSHVDR
jgi:hypothetical protein